MVNEQFELEIHLDPDTRVLYYALLATRILMHRRAVFSFHEKEVLPTGTVLHITGILLDTHRGFSQKLIVLPVPHSHHVFVTVVHR